MLFKNKIVQNINLIFISKANENFFYKIDLNVEIPLTKDKN